MNASTVKLHPKGGTVLLVGNRYVHPKSLIYFINKTRQINPYFFGHDIYEPKSLEQGGPFTIGRVIHSNRHATLSAWIGGVAVFDRALSDEEMKKLATIGNCSAVVQ